MKNFIPEHGGYKKLITYQRAEIIFDATVYFTKRYLSKGAGLFQNGGLRERMTRTRLSARGR